MKELEQVKKIYEEIYGYALNYDNVQEYKKMTVEAIDDARNKKQQIQKEIDELYKTIKETKEKIISLRLYKQDINAELDDHLEFAECIA